MAEEEGPQAPLILKGAQDPPAPPVPQASEVPQALQQPIPHMPPINWSQFKPKFAGKSEEDAEAHLFRTNDWIDTHRFQENDKDQRFCLTLTGRGKIMVQILKTNKCRLDRNYKTHFNSSIQR